MIKVAIEGAETLTAGELIRILILHPEIEIVSVASKKYAGYSIQGLHHGLDGERAIKISATPDYENADVAFLCSIDAVNDGIEEKYPHLKTIYVPERKAPLKREDLVMGFPEIYRKELVRGAKSAYVPLPLTSVALAALFPLAKNLMLNPKEDIVLDVVAPKKEISDERLATARQEIRKALRHVQTSFDANIRFRAYPNCQDVVSVDVKLPATTDVEHLEKIFEEAYSDHNFTFFSHHTLYPYVAGTQKILYNAYIDADSKKFAISTIGDPVMRGGAGEAVHVMNLLCGLHEKTGITFKAKEFHNRNLVRS